MIIRLIIAAALLTLAACSPTPSAPPRHPWPPPGTPETRTLQERTYSVWRPGNWKAGTAYPIIVGLHGAGGGDLNSMIGLGTHAEGYIAVFPNNSAGRRWNDGQAENDDGIDDVAWILAIVADVVKDGGDPARAFVMGMSNGAVLTQRLACDAGDKFLAFASVSGLKPEGYACASTTRSPIVFFHGTDDTLMPWGGGMLEGSKPVLSATASFQFWATKNGCTGETVQALPDKVNDGTTVRKHVFGTCEAETVQYEIVGGGHAWAGPPPSRRAGDSQDIDATTEILSFFRGHGL